MEARSRSRGPWSSSPRGRVLDGRLTTDCRSGRPITAGDRAAFRTVYAFLALQVWRDAIRLLPHLDARAVTRSTFVEMWHLADHHLDHEGRETFAWIAAITARHTRRPCGDQATSTRHSHRPGRRRIQTRRGTPGRDKKETANAHSGTHGQEHGHQ